MTDTQRPDPHTDSPADQPNASADAAPIPHDVDMTGTPGTSASISAETPAEIPAEIPADTPPDSVPDRPGVPEMAAPASPPGPAERMFSTLAALGLLIPLLLVFAQTCLGLDARDLWFSDEVRHGAAYQALRQSGDWLILTLNGVPYPDKPPLYFWFLRLLDELPLLDPPVLFLTAAALCGLLFTGATWLLARALGYDKKTSFAATLVLLSSFSFLGITHYARMDLLFATCIILSQACLFRGWIKDSAPLWMVSGFVLAALACLIKGPLGLAFPLITSIIFLIWRGTFRRAGGRDGAFGFALMLIILLAWVFAVMLQPDGAAYLRSMFGRHMIERAVDAWHHKQAWWFYLANMPLAWMPWTPLLLFLPWGRLPRLLTGLSTARHTAPGHGWVWISCISGFVLLSLLSGKVAIYTLPLYPLLAILTAQGLLALSPLRSRTFFFLIALLFGLLGLVFGLVTLAHLGKDYLAPLLSTLETLIPEAALNIFLPHAAGIFSPDSPTWAYLTTIQGAPYLAIICLVLAWLLSRHTDRTRPGGALLVVTLGFVALAQPLALVTAPSLNRLMSPAPQAAILRDYAARGYHVISFSVTTGTYTYHMGGPMDEVNSWEELAERLATYPNLIVATRLNRWKEWQQRPDLDPQAFTVLDTQWIAERRYVVLLRTGTPDAQTQELPRDQAGQTHGRADDPNASQPPASSPEPEASAPAPEEATPDTPDTPTPDQTPQTAPDPSEPDAVLHL